MPAHTKRRRTDIIELYCIGPAENREKALDCLRSLNFREMEDSVSWRQAFPNVAPEQESGYGLKGARFKEDLTQEQLSRLTGIPRRHISEMENGKRPIGKINSRKFAKALKVDYRVFL